MWNTNVFEYFVTKNYLFSDKSCYFMLVLQIKIYCQKRDIT